MTIADCDAEERRKGKQGITSWILAGLLLQFNSPEIPLSGGIYLLNRKT
ncbi:hypothetical protein LINPERPRIM_LOCUS29417, partial [Linum perenne]